MALTESVITSIGLAIGVVAATKSRAISAKKTECDSRRRQRTTKSAPVIVILTPTLSSAREASEYRTSYPLYLFWSKSVVGALATDGLEPLHELVFDARVEVQIR